MDTQVTAEPKAMVGPPVVDAEISFDDLRPYSGREMAADQRLRDVVLRVAEHADNCPNGPIILPARSDFQVCGTDDIAQLRTALVAMAPVLVPERLTGFVIADMGGDGEGDLIASYQLEECFDPTPAPDGVCEISIEYLVFSLFQWTGESYQVSHAGNFLFGELHAVTAFGEDERHKSLLIRFDSCFACHSWGFLFAVEFSGDPDGTAFEFTYAVDHGSWRPRIEYRLPGAGHSVEASTDTRIPDPAGSDGPHLMQFFDLEEGADEWWLFRCQDHRCNYELFEDTLPAEYRPLWENALRL